ncbi:hypothetical protein MUK42_34663 [Musa troglodytarum]|uniref:Uncharacterized protein n=1 Tax=Musa troglodytarum TaxID=320322 RepID=A0A9E7K914_9LILI|nr:hypothetical protein MUK42_34663 [Musa troglodytarum]
MPRWNCSSFHIFYAARQCWMIQFLIFLVVGHRMTTYGVMAAVASTMVAEAEADPSDAVLLVPPLPACDAAATLNTPRTEASSSAAPSAARMSTAPIRGGHNPHPTLLIGRLPHLKRLKRKVMPWMSLLLLFVRRGAVAP